jgi:hypothetical protein
MIKLAEWRGKKFVKHHALTDLNSEQNFKKDLYLFKLVIPEQLIGYCDAPGHLAFITDHHRQRSPHQGSHHPTVGN